jgi:hypothetical protein
MKKEESATCVVSVLNWTDNIVLLGDKKGPLVATMCPQDMNKKTGNSDVRY